MGGNHAAAAIACGILLARAGEGPLSEASAGPDQHLFRRFLEGEPAAVARVESLVGRVVRFRGYYIPAAERRDVVQDALLQIWDAVNETDFSFSKNFEALIRSITYRTCVDWMRRKRPPAAEIVPAFADPAGRPDSPALHQEQILLGLQVLREMREPCRRLFRLFVVDEMSYRRIADLEGRTEGALRTQMAQCLKEARDLLDRVRRRRGPWPVRQGRAS
jgi:RNA polymerase sigma factor (sigma-70 family)